MGERKFKEPFVLVEAPRAMTREAKRLIFAKINEVYLDHGYDRNWSDNRIAKDIDVPVAWVKDVREENFGPESLSEEANKLMTEGEQLVQKLRLEANIIAGHLKEGEKTREVLLKRADFIAGRLAEIGKQIQ